MRKVTCYATIKHHSGWIELVTVHATTTTDNTITLMSPRIIVGRKTPPYEYKNMRDIIGTVLNILHNNDMYVSKIQAGGVWYHNINFIDLDTGLSDKYATPRKR